MQFLSVVVSICAAGILSATVGCGQANDKTAEDDDHEDHKHPPVTQAAGHTDHSGYWCTPHGVPEEICGRCNAKYAKQCQDKGDWCEKHERPDSQCFVCSPQLAETFAAIYRDKNEGKDPPPIPPE